MTLPVSRWVLLVLAAVALVVGIDNMERPLANPDEGRYSEISREMAASGDWVTPRLNGLKYFEKPPLQYWATAVAFRAFGESEYTARLYIGLCGLATILVAGFVALRLTNPATALATMMVLLSSPYFMALGGIVTLDMGLTLWTTASFGALLLAEQSAARPREHRAWMLAAWAAMALAVLSKGLVGIVFAGAAVAVQVALQRDLSILRRLEWGFGALVFFVLAAPWFVAVSFANPEFPHFFFVHEHFERFLTRSHGRVEAPWYFLPIVFIGFLPWMFALPAAIAHAWRSDPGARFRPWRLMAVWAVFVVAFFSLSGSKLPAYVLPAFPALALILARYLAEAPPRRLAIWAALVIPAAVAVGWLAWRFPDAARDPWTRSLYLEAQGWALGAAALLLVSSVNASVLLFLERRWLAIATVALTGVLLVECLENAYEELSPRQSGMDVARKMVPFIKPGTRLYSVEHYEQSVPFYIGRTMILVNYVDEFDMGLKAEPGRGLLLAAFPADWQRPGDALAIMQPDSFRKMKALDLPMVVLHEDPRRVLVRKP